MQIEACQLGLLELLLGFPMCCYGMVHLFCLLLTFFLSCFGHEGLQFGRQGVIVLAQGSHDRFDLLVFRWG